MIYGYELGLVFCVIGFYQSVSTVARISFYKEVVFILHLSRQQKYTSYWNTFTRSVVVSFIFSYQINGGVLWIIHLLTRPSGGTTWPALLIVLGNERSQT